MISVRCSAFIAVVRGI